MKSKFFAGMILIFLGLISFACSTEKNNSLADNRPLPTGGLANPAAVKCIRDGYKLEPIKENGVSRKYFCVNKTTGMKCEIWSYFRGECNLSP